MENLFIGAAGGLIAGAVLLLVEHLVHRHERNRDTAKQRIIRFTNEDRRITGSIFNDLGPRSSIELMKSELRPPNEKTKETVGLFVEDIGLTEPKEINSYVYFFKNAAVKISSEDGETINSLTVLATDTDISFNNVFFHQDEARDEFLNVATLTPEMLEGCRAEEFLGCRECFTAAQKTIGNPFWVHLTYFCDYSSGDEGGDITKTPELLVGSVINGICLSSESETASYIFISDMT